MRSPRIESVVGCLAMLPLMAACPTSATNMPASTPASPASNSNHEAASTSRPDAEFLRQYAMTMRFSLGMPMAVRPTPDGKAVLFLRSEPDSMTRDLYSFDVATGQEKVLLRAQDLVATEGPLPDEEKARRERQRMIAAGIGRYALSDDGRFILAPLSGRLYLVERATGAIRKLESQAGWPIDPHLSPDASRLAYIVDHDLYTIDVASGKETRLTQREGEHIQHGEAEFVAQEEMRRYRGFWWSPDSKFLAYQRTDLSKVELLHIADPSRPEQPPATWRYPRVGTNNADVGLGIMPVTGGATVWVEWDRTAYPYLAKVVWSKNAPLTILVQNRAQTEELLLAVDSKTGKTRTLLTERDDTWVNIDARMPQWLDDGKHFLWTTERNGWWQLELRDADGKLVRALTRTDFPLRGFLHLDEANDAIYVYGNAGDDPTQQHVYRISSLSQPGEPAPMTEGRGFHSVSFSDNGAIFVHTELGLEGPVRTRVVRADGQEVGVIKSNAPTPPFEANIELTKVTVQDRTHWAFLVRPRDFSPERRYPVLVHVYGGPHSSMVKAIGRYYLKDQWIADHGFIVVGIDGRGTPDRGREWERAIKNDLSTVPLEDQVAGLQALGATYKELDLGRVGIYGWSFGGYMSAMAVMRRPDVFHVGIAGAPVTDWHDYDTHYTERYMGLAEGNVEGYKVANVLTYAQGLERPLMIIHGTGDDNVYVVHSMKLVNELTMAGKPFTFVPLLGRTHMVADPNMSIRLEQRYMDFFIEHLQGAGPGQEARK